MNRALFGTLTGRATMFAVAVKFLVLVVGARGRLGTALGVLDNLASVALLAVVAVLIARGLALANRRLLWRVRRKLIISYIFIGVVPAILIVAFFLLAGLLLFSNVSSYLVQSRLQALADRAQSVSQMTAIDVQRLVGASAAGAVVRRQGEADREFPGLSMTLLPITRPCSTTASSTAPSPYPRGPGPLVTAGTWAHVEPPSLIPGWITCDGFKGLLASARPGGPPVWPVDEAPLSLAGLGAPVNVVVRAVTFSELAMGSYAVVVDIPVGPSLITRLQRETGVLLTDIRSIDTAMHTLEARSQDAPVPEVLVANVPLASVAFLEYTDWADGHRSTLHAGILMDVVATYGRIAASQGEVGRYAFGHGLLLVLVVIGVLFLIIEALALAAGWALARSITGSVHELFVGTERVRARDFTHKVAIRAEDQLGELADSFNHMTDSIESLLLEQDEKKRLEEELRIAHDIQMSLLPQGPIGLPGLSVTALSVPAREVGGDYYDFLRLGDHRVGILIADVSGKGTSAALYMAELKGLILALSRVHTSPRDLLVMANRIIAEHLDARSFITMTYAVFDLQARTVTYARAGHTPLMHLPSATKQLRVLAPGGMAVGLTIDNGEMFERLLLEETLSIEHGDLFLLFTDGISEAMNTTGDCFGEERLGRLVEEHAHLPSDELRERLLRDISAFAGDAPQHDDMTLIILRVGEPVISGAAVTNDQANVS
ncbi:MAG: PP2C family protein-serine/threonine phosphatase [Vicinamibacterales bacterium]